MRNAVASEVASLAASQWGLVTAAQASAAGISRMQLTRMVDAGLLDRVMHGVYATPGVQGDQRLTLRAAWLTIDPGTAAEKRMANLPTAGVVSHASAAQLLGLGDLVADEHEFTVPHRHQSTRAGVRVRKGVLEPGEVTIADGLPVTTPARTIADLLMVGHELEHVAAVVADALRRDLIDGPVLEVALAPAARRHDARDGAALLVRLLDLSGMGVEDLERQVLDNDLGRELVRKAAGAHSLAELAESSPGMMAAMESIMEAVRAVMDTPGMREITARAYDVTRVMNSPGRRAAANAAARLADSPGMRAALSKAAQAQRLYDSPGMRAALDSAAQTRLHDSPAARALTQLAEHAAEVTSQVDPDQLRALAEAARGAFSPVSVARVLDPDPGVRREPPLALPPAERGTE
jgi:hypothetical protein